MKKLVIKSTGLLLLFAAVLFAFSSCSANNGIEPVSCELIETTDGVNGIFIIHNKEKSTIDNLKITVKAYDQSNKETGTYNGKYVLYVDPDHEATVTVALPDGSKKAIVTEYSYTLGKKEKNGSFDKNNVATFMPTTTADTKIDTRKELADVLIEDIRHQFMLQKYEASGYYDEEKKQVIIASYANKTYDECYYSHSLEPGIYNALAQSIKQMSLTCYEEFQNHNFTDVKVSVGFLSSDKKIMISATNGEIVDNFG